MKKFVFIILPLFLLCFAVAKSSFAAPPPPPPLPSPTSSTVLVPGPNPGPPVGTPCGNTMCLENETCVQYPQDIDQHCVPNDFDPLDYTADPDVPPQCASGTGVFPPNSTCWNNFKNTQDKIGLYDKTCIYEPVIHYTSIRWLRNKGGGDYDQSYEMCGMGECGPDCPVAPGGGGDAGCTVAALVHTDVRDAELGSYGPSLAAEAQYSTDFTAQNYLYNALFGRPMNLSDSYDPKDAAKNGGYPTREAYRTYWRLLPASNQANLRSFIFNMAHDDLIINTFYHFTDTNGLKKSTNLKSLYDALSKQVILFWHFPFIRIGCLTSYPVCPEHAQAIRELKPNFEDLRNAALKLNLPLATAAIQAYNVAIAALGGDLDGPYNAFVPLDFTSTRGYIVKKKDEVEVELYARYDTWLRDTYNSGRYGTEKPGLTNVSRENLPYVGAIYQGTLSPKFGLFPALQPSWLIDRYATQSSMYDYAMGNKLEDLPEVKIARRNFMEALKEETAALLSNPLGWISSKIRSFFTDEDKLKGYTAIGVDNPDSVVRRAYSNMYCPLPLSYHLLSPKTAADAPGTVPKPLDDHHQIIYIPGKQIAWNYSPTHHTLEWKNVCHTQRFYPYNDVCEWKQEVCPKDDEHYQIGDECYKRRWVVDAIKHGKALTVLNNPKQTDIKEMTVNDDKYSFFKMMLPAGAGKISDASIDAPYAKNFVSNAGLATGPNTGLNPAKSVMLNPAEPINRINNLAQDSMHILQNCWVVPGDLQNSPRCSFDFPKEASTSACTGEAFKAIAGEKYKPSAAAESYFGSFISPNLVPEVITAYAEAEKQTGVPCEVLAGIHFKEGNNSPDQDLQSGAPLGNRTLSESAIQAAEELKGKAGGDITNMEQLIMALSYYNGGGNSNCQSVGSNSCAPTDRCGQTVACATDPNACNCSGPEVGSCRATCTSGFPYQFNYSFCPPPGTGYDDPYVTNLWRSPAHDQMYILYMYDCTATKPYIDSRPGTLTVAISLFLQETTK